MRVISGKYRGKKLISPTDNSVRPTVDRVKESFFNIIQFEIANSSFLDLFSGTGSIGIEALSRGAEKIVFCDESVDLLKRNLKGMEDSKTIIIQNNCFSAISVLSRSGEKFDFIYVDPPFDTNLGERAIEKIVKENILNVDGLIAFEHPTKKNINIDCGEVEIYNQRNYGFTTISFLKLKKGSNVQ